MSDALPDRLSTDPRSPYYNPDLFSGSDHSGVLPGYDGGWDGGSSGGHGSH